MKKLMQLEVIENFLSYMEFVRTEYEDNFGIINEEDRKLQDFLHDIEFVQNKQERNKIAAQFQQSRKRRRKAIDKVLELEKIYNFQKDQNNRLFFDRLKETLQQLQGTKKYPECHKEYKRRVGDDG